jgi:putative Mg2+ transporter-C (MgtC) family protein
MFHSLWAQATLAVGTFSFAEDLTRLTLAVALGGAIGLEREWKGHWAGLRTHILVAMGCAIFVIAGIEIVGRESESVTRVIQGVASGIGFLGAGTILKLDQKQEIKGLTTAASIWLAAALGTAAGSGEYALATAAVLASLFVLGVLGPIEAAFERRHKKQPKPAKEKAADSDNSSRQV